MKQKLTIEETIARLEAKGYAVKKSGGTYRSQCPAHDGKDLNLAFKLGDNGQVVFTCHSHQCSFEEIMAGFGIEKDEKPAKQTAFGKKVHQTFEDAVGAYACGDQPKEKPDKIYRYDNEDGSENLFMLRWDGAESKRIRPITKVHGGYICGESTDGALPIYNLPKIAEHIRTASGNARIVVTEGEKAADTATSLGFVATTSPFGSKSWHKANWDVLDRLALKHGKKLELILLPDNDEPGRNYAENVAEKFMSFRSQPIVKTVSICDFRDVTGIADFPKGGDLFDLCEILDSKTDEEIAAMIDVMIAKVMPEAIIEDLDDGAIRLFRPFPVHVLPTVMAEHVTANAAASGCDPANVALSDLVAAASAIGNSRRLELKHGWIFHSSLWGMIVSRKGAVKTWSMVPSIKPLHLIQEEYHRQYDLEKAEYDRQRAEYAKLSPKQRREEPAFTLKEPVRRRILSRDATEARIVKNMAENLRGFCIFCDELSTLMKGFGQFSKDGKGGNGQSLFNSLFNGEGIESERIGENRYAPYSCISILGSIQPAMAKRCFDQESFESGFASRFLIVAPPLRVASWSDAVVPEEIDANFEQLIHGLMHLEMEPVYAASTTEYDEWNPDGSVAGEAVGSQCCAWSPSNPALLHGRPSEGPGADCGPAASWRPVLIGTSPDALHVYQEFFDRTAEEMRATDDDNVRGAFEKMRTYAARLALVIHIVRVVEQRIMRKHDRTTAPWSGDRINEFECDADSMRVAVVLADWFKYETRRAYSTWGGVADETPMPKVDPFQQRVIEFMEQKQEPVSLRDLKRKFRAEAQEMDKAVGELMLHGLIEPTVPEKASPGPRKEVYRLKK